MLFHTWTFLLFFAIVYPVYFALKSTRFKIPWLLLASYVFYAGWNPMFLPLILFSTVVDYWSVVGMSKTQYRKPWLFLSLINNLGLLGFFKYGDFLTENINELLLWLNLPLAISLPSDFFFEYSGMVADGINALLTNLHLPYAVPIPDAMLPVGISFFIFQSMSYTIDYYRGNVERETSFIRYATFVSLFPQLVAGPIERAKNLLPQLRSTPKIELRDISDGLSLFVVGLFKKVAMADALAVYVDQVYGMPGEYQSPALLLASFAFAWQIYFDFSGYTDMARGVARMMGFRLMLNFNNPYLATSLGDFWRRWHISLSTWFKDYVYIPLGGNRNGEFRTYVNMCLTMIISGLWHGAMWTFILWGAVHALGRVLTRALESTSFYNEQVPRLLKQVLTFSLVTLAWVFFRAESCADAGVIFTRIATSGWGDPALPLVLLGMVLSIWLYQYVHESKLRKLLALTPVRIGLVVAMVLYLAIFTTSSDQAFIYFQF